MLTSISTIVLAALLVSSDTRLPAPSASTGTIAVTQIAVAECVPSELLISLTVETVAPLAIDAAESHIARMREVLSGLERISIPKDRIRTDRISLRRNQVRKDNEWAYEGFAAFTSIEFPLTAIETYAEVWCSLASMDGVLVNGVMPVCTREAELQREARRSALTLAKQKAEEMASVLDCKVIRPLHIVELSEDMDVNRVMLFESRGSPIGDASGGLSPPPIALGTISISSSVAVTFETAPR